MPKPLSSFIATLTQVALSTVGLVVGLGILSQSSGGHIVAIIGFASGAAVQLGNSIYALAHAHLASAVVASNVPEAQAIRAELVKSA